MLLQWNGECFRWLGNWWKGSIGSSTKKARKLLAHGRSFDQSIRVFTENVTYVDQQNVNQCDQQIVVVVKCKQTGNTTTSALCERTSCPAPAEKNTMHMHARKPKGLRFATLLSLASLYTTHQPILHFEEDTLNAGPGMY